MEEVYNFNAGPAVLPKAVMLKAQEEFVNYHGIGYGIIEESHRNANFEEVITSCEANIRKLMGISDDYEVLFLQGGGSTQFAMVPMNLMIPGKKVGYCDTGEWAHKAMKEAKILGGDVDLVYDGSACKYTTIGDASAWKVNPDYAYVYMCCNNTIYGTEYQSYPQTGDVPLVADMSSDMMSRPVDVSKFGIIFAGAQKNIGPAGVTLVIIRKDLASRCPANIPTMFRYSTHIDKKSLFNTPPTFCIYMMRLVTDWLIGLGGIPAIQKMNAEKAAKLYAAIDGSNGFFRGTAAVADRSKMNVCFRIGEGDDVLEKKFVAEAKAAGLVGVKGHRAVGGLRASIYNAMPLAGVEKLIAFMADFAKNN
ncbi:MAG: 3-phosphoserine/phosphohydroxythreonine transaminase [Victivallales bacterium]|nr:3-phosphoserine/phosphohydroxythreonine transaminase [Victivallales bacterium]